MVKNIFILIYNILIGRLKKSYMLIIIVFHIISEYQKDNKLNSNIILKFHSLLIKLKAFLILYSLFTVLIRKYN